MSANISAAPFEWLQPVRYDLDAFRQFAHGLDKALDALVDSYQPRKVGLESGLSASGLPRQIAMPPHVDTPPKSESC